MRRLTASRLHIALHCVNFLREDVEWVKDTSTYAVVGSGTHQASDDLISMRLPNLRAIADEYGMSQKESARASAMVARYTDWFGRQNTENWRSEVKLAWDPFSDSYIQIKSEKPRDYSELNDLPFAVCGTADIAYEESLDHDVIACTDDIKTGFGRKVDAEIQGGMLTMMLAQKERADRGRFRILRVDEVEEVRPIPFNYTKTDFRAIKAKIRDVIKAAINDPEPIEGPWCGYCPARFTCKAALSAVEQSTDLVAPEKLVRKHRLALKPTGMDHAAWTATAIKLARDVLDKAEEGLREFADEHGGVQLPDGSVLKKWPDTVREVSLNAEAIKFLETRLPKALEKGAHATISSITKAAGGKAGASAVFDELRRLGALKDKPKPKFEARKVSP